MPAGRAAPARRTACRRRSRRSSLRRGASSSVSARRTSILGGRPRGGSVSTMPDRRARRRRRARARAAGRPGRPASQTTRSPTCEAASCLSRAHVPRGSRRAPRRRSSGVEPEPLRDVPAGWSSAAEPEHVPVGDDPLVAGPSGTYVFGFSASSRSRGRHPTRRAWRARRAGRPASGARRVLDVRARLGELRSAARSARQRSTLPCPALYAASTSALVAVLAEEVREVPGAVADVDLRVRGGRSSRNCEPPVRSAIPWAVAGVSCISPIAPDDERGAGVGTSTPGRSPPRAAPGRGRSRGRGRGRTRSSGAGSGAARTSRRLDDDDVEGQAAGDDGDEQGARERRASRSQIVHDRGDERVELLERAGVHVA